MVHTLVLLGSLWLVTSAEEPARALLEHGADREAVAAAHLQGWRVATEKGDAELARLHLRRALLADADLEAGEDPALAAAMEAVEQEISDAAPTLAHTVPADTTVTPLPLVVTVEDALERVRVVVVEGSLVVDGQRVGATRTVMRRDASDSRRFTGDLDVPAHAPGAVTTLNYSFSALDEWGDVITLAEGAPTHEVLLHVVPPPVAGFIALPRSSQETAVVVPTPVRTLPRVSTVLAVMTMVTLVVGALSGGATLASLGMQQAWPWLAGQAALSEDTTARVRTAMWGAATVGAVSTLTLVIAGVALAVATTVVTVVVARFFS